MSLDVNVRPTWEHKQNCLFRRPLLVLIQFQIQFPKNIIFSKGGTLYKRGLSTRKLMSIIAPSSRESKHFIALYKPSEIFFLTLPREKSYPNL